MKIIGPVFEWKTELCNCRAQQVMGGDTIITPCSEEHLPWAEKICASSFIEKSSCVEKAYRRGIPQSFCHIFERYTKGGCSFHRPKKLPSIQIR